MKMIDHNHFICHLILGTFTEYPKGKQDTEPHKGSVFFYSIFRMLPPPATDMAFFPIIPARLFLQETRHSNIFCTKTKNVCTNFQKTCRRFLKDKRQKSRKQPQLPTLMPTTIFNPPSNLALKITPARQEEISIPENPANANDNIH